MADSKLKVGCRVQITGKDVVGTVAFIGATLFSSGKWVGVILDEAKGKNNGTVQGKQYFSCEENHGMFIRPTQLVVIDDSGQTTPTSSKLPLPGSTIKRTSISKSASRERLSKGASPSETPKKPSPEAPPAKSFVEDVKKELAAKENQDTIRALTESVAKISALETEITTLKKDKEDVDEKLEVLKAKRSEDRQKLKEFDKIKLRVEQLEEYKHSAQEKSAQQQRSLLEAKNELKDVQEQFERYKEEMQDAAETIEMATLDKEMAEEKIDSLQQELSATKEKYEETALDLQILKEELENSSESAGQTYQMKQLEQQNERLKAALVKLRDLDIYNKQEINKYQKTYDKQNNEISHLRKEKETLQGEIKNLNEASIEMSEQIDAALGAEEMVEKLTRKNLELEERIQQLEQEQEDLETLHQMNEELQENSRETELELREANDLLRAKLTESIRRLELNQDSISDYERTITKFRDLVAQLQEEIRSLKENTENVLEKRETPTIDFHAKQTEMKNFSQIIDFNLLNIQCKQSAKNINYLLSFLPDSLKRSGCEIDAIKLVLLVSSMIQKTDFLLNQIRQKWKIPDEINQEDVLKNQTSDQYSYISFLQFQLCSLKYLLQKYEDALNSCSDSLLLKVCSLLPEIKPHEKCIDLLLDLLKKDLLDETVNLEGLQKAVNYLKHLYSVHLAEEFVDPVYLAQNSIAALVAGSNSLKIDTTRMKYCLLAEDSNSEINILLKDTENFVVCLISELKKIKRRDEPLQYQKNLFMEVEDCLNKLAIAIKSLRHSSVSVLRQADLLSEKIGMNSAKMTELLNEAAEKFFDVLTVSPFEAIRQNFEEILEVVKTFTNAIEEGKLEAAERVVQKTEKPILVRSHAVRVQLADTEGVKAKLEDKDEALKEVKQQLRIKIEEISENNVRISLLEKKVESASREADDRADKLQLKVDEMTMKMRQKEKEFEETVDALQADTDALEQEKIELKDRLKALSRKTLLEGLARQPSTAQSQASVRENPLLVEKVNSISSALKVEQSKNLRLTSKNMINTLKSLPQLNVPKVHQTTEVKEVERKVKSLVAEIYHEACTPKIGAKDKWNELEKQLIKTKSEVESLIAERHSVGHVSTNTKAFSSPDLNKVLTEKINEKEVIVGVIKIPKKGCKDIIKLPVNERKLERIHGALVR
ncbi:DgyrCDS11706 [Dimorphilus gyrociliatus]|uniref:Dynactin subunit 1 n=1 Tax=Dimorphilus gyrociliatus TaxID=2664684 RepID=A0A7I8W887_9ANNE|nr:DgyrCDS11706 [Dimorphilus gyrociliatus]